MCVCVCVCVWLFSKKFHCEQPHSLLPTYHMIYLDYIVLLVYTTLVLVHYACWLCLKAIIICKHVVHVFCVLAVVPLFCAYQMHVRIMYMYSPVCTCTCVFLVPFLFLCTLTNKKTKGANVLEYTHCTVLVSMGVFLF